MSDGAMTRDATIADGALDAPLGGVRSGEQQPTEDRPADEATPVVVDTRGKEINPLPTTMTVAEALDDSLGPRR